MTRSDVQDGSLRRVRSGGHQHPDGWRRASSPTCSLTPTMPAHPDDASAPALSEHIMRFKDDGAIRWGHTRRRNNFGYGPTRTPPVADGPD